MLFFTFLLLSSSFFAFIVSKFPPHDPKEDKMVLYDLNDLHFKDHESCGLFKPPPENGQSVQGRVYLGTNASIGQFPWTVCFIRPVGPLIYRIGDNSYPFNGDFHPAIYNIFNHGYDFSTDKGEMFFGLHSIADWIQDCTGTIIDKSWIITAAHCFKQQWEGSFVIAAAGTVDCLQPQFNEEFMREIHIYRSPQSPHRTIFEQPGWTERKGKDPDFWHDLALVRLDKEYDLPDVYTDQPINRVCIYSTDNFPTDGCLNNVYYSGYGRKGLPNELPGKISYLTWAKFWRTSGLYCNLMALRNVYNPTGQCPSCGDEKFNHAYCFTTTEGHFGLGDPGQQNINFEMLGYTEFEAVKNFPNTCPGDSGGPFVYYMRDEIEDANSNDATQAPKYRALLMATLYGLPRGTTKLCEAEYYEPKFKGLYHKTISVGPALWRFVDKEWWKSVMRMDARGSGGVTYAYERYPDVTVY